MRGLVCHTPFFLKQDYNEFISKKKLPSSRSQVRSSREITVNLLQEQQRDLVKLAKKFDGI